MFTYYLIYRLVSEFSRICTKSTARRTAAIKRHVKGDFRHELLGRTKSPLNPFPCKRKPSRGTRSREAFRTSTRRQIDYLFPYFLWESRLTGKLCAVAAVRSSLLKSRSQPRRSYITKTVLVFHTQLLKGSEHLRISKEVRGSCVHAYIFYRGYHSYSVNVHCCSAGERQNNGDRKKRDKSLNHFVHPRRDLRG